MRVSIAAVCLLVGCSAGDLTLPDSGNPSVNPPVSLRIFSGDGQRADPGELLDRPLVVEVLDSEENPVSGASVEFSFLGEVPGAAIDPALTTTDDEGRAQAFIRLGTEDGEQMIVARVAGTASPDLTARFSAIARDGNGDGDGKKDGKGKGNGGGHDGNDDD